MSDTNRPYGGDDGSQERAQKFIAGIPYAHTHSVTGCRACAGEMAEIATLRARVAEVERERMRGDENERLRGLAADHAADMEREVDTLRADLANLATVVERLTREREDYREKRANEVENLRARVAELEAALRGWGSLVGLPRAKLFAELKQATRAALSGEGDKP